MSIGQCRNIAMYMYMEKCKPSQSGVCHSSWDFSCLLKENFACNLLKYFKTKHGLMRNAMRNKQKAQT